MSSYLELGDLHIVQTPYRYAYTDKVLPQAIALSILSWLESLAPWYLKETDFYEQWEFDFKTVELPENLAFIKSKDSFAVIKSFMESTFQTQLKDKIDFTAHKLLEGQRIRIHNDFIPGLETHRLIIQLNQGWKDEFGGLLMLFNSGDPNDLHQIVRPTHNSMFAFEISEKSHHAVSRMYEGGERYTLVYSFYKEDSIAP